MIRSWDRADFSVLRPQWSHPFLITPTTTFLNQLLISINLHQHEKKKNQAFLSFCSRDIADLKILQSDWLRAFWPISQEPDLFQVWDLPKNTTNNINFIYIWWLNFPINSKNPIFGPFSSFSGQKIFFQKIWPSHAL